MNFDKNAFNNALEIVEKWDFSLAIEKLISTNPIEWDLKRAEEAVKNYKRYMAVTKATNGQQLVPNADIDQVWHLHILDTRAYYKDCLELFGSFLHHYPYFGMLDSENHQQWKSAQCDSEKLWLELFQEPLYAIENTPQKCPQACPCNMDEGQPSGLDLNYNVA